MNLADLACRCWTKVKKRIRLWMRRYCGEEGGYGGNVMNLVVEGGGLG
jgi:hypothetical protein